MRITINRDKLLKPLTSVGSVVEKRQTLPILANVLLRLENTDLRLTGTDLEVEVTTLIEDVEGDPGQCTVTARKLLDICRAMPENADIDIEANEEKVVVKSGRSRFVLQALPHSDFPLIEASDWEERLVVSQGVFKSLLEKTAFSMAQQDVRYYLNGLLLEIGKGKLRAVATDGHRLAKSETDIDGGDPKKLRQSIVPRKAIQELSRLLGDLEDGLTMEFSSNHARFTFDNLVFISKLIDGRFPDYQAVMSPELPVSIEIDRGEFHETLSRAAILSNEKFRGIRLHLSEGRMRVSANNPEQEEATDEMPVEYGGDELEIGFNVTYLMDALKAIDANNVQLRLKDANSSCTLNIPDETETQFLVMPMRL